MGKLYKKCSVCDKTIKRPEGYEGLLLCLTCRNKKLRPPKKCTNCNKLFVPYKIKNKFCSTSCASTYNGKLRKPSNITKNKIKNTCLLEITKNRKKETSIKNHGFEYAQQSPLVKEKMRNTYIKKYDVGFVSTGLKIKYYKNTNIYYQGKNELKFLELCESLNIIENIKRGPSIKYMFNNSNKIYLSDFLYIPINLVIEIKSMYIYNLSSDKCEEKRKETINQGYDFLFVIDNNFTEFIKKALPKKSL